MNSSWQEYQAAMQTINEQNSMKQAQQQVESMDLEQAREQDDADDNERDRQVESITDTLGTIGITEALKNETLDKLKKKIINKVGKGFGKLVGSELEKRGLPKTAQFVNTLADKGGEAAINEQIKFAKEAGARKLTETAKPVLDKLEEGKQALIDKAADIKQAALDKSGELQEQAEGAAQQVIEEGAGAAEKVGEAGAGVAERVAGAAEKVGEAGEEGAGFLAGAGEFLKARHTELTDWGQRFARALKDPESSEALRQNSTFDTLSSFMDNEGSFTAPTAEDLLPNGGLPAGFKPQGEGNLLRGIDMPQPDREDLETRIAKLAEQHKAQSDKIAPKIAREWDEANPTEGTAKSEPISVEKEKPLAPEVNQPEMPTPIEEGATFSEEDTRKALTASQQSFVDDFNRQFEALPGREENARRMAAKRYADNLLGKGGLYDDSDDEEEDAPAVAPEEDAPVVAPEAEAVEAAAPEVEAAAEEPAAALTRAEKLDQLKVRAENLQQELKEGLKGIEKPQKSVAELQEDFRAAVAKMRAGPQPEPAPEPAPERVSAVSEDIDDTDPIPADYVEPKLQSLDEMFARMPKNPNIPLYADEPKVDLNVPDVPINQNDLDNLKIINEREPTYGLVNDMRSDMRTMRGIAAPIENIGEEAERKVGEPVKLVEQAVERAAPELAPVVAKVEEEAPKVVNVIDEVDSVAAKSEPVLLAADAVDQEIPFLDVATDALTLAGASSILGVGNAYRDKRGAGLQRVIHNISTPMQGLSLGEH